MYTIEPPPEARVDQLEQDAEDVLRLIPKDKHQDYRLMVRRALGHIRTQITSMRALGKRDYEINKALPELFETFYAARNRFTAENKVYSKNQSRVWDEHRTTARKIDQCIQDFEGFEPEFSLDDDEPNYLQEDPFNSERYCPKAEESIPVSHDPLIRNHMMETIAEARGTAAVLNGVGRVVKETAAIVLGCRSSEQGAKNCAKVREQGEKLSKKVVETTKAIVTRVGAKPVAQRILNEIAKVNALPNRLIEHGISSEMAHQYVRDSVTIGIGTIGGGVTALKLLDRAVPLKVPKKIASLASGEKHPIPTAPSSLLKKTIVRFLTDESGAGPSASNGVASMVQRVVSKTNLPTGAPKLLPAFAEAVKVKSKNMVRGGGAIRKRWKDNRHIYEWDSRHGYVGKYDLRGKHLGKFDAESGTQIAPANPRKIITP